MKTDTKSVGRWGTIPLLLALALSTALLAPHDLGGQSTPPPDPQEIPRIEALAFLIGEWELSTWFEDASGRVTRGTAELTAEWVLGERGIQMRQVFPSEDGAPDFMSTTVYAANAPAGRILGVGINTLGNAKTYEVTIEPDRVVVIQGGMLFEGRSGINRLTYFNVAPGSHELLFEHSEDDGSMWVREYGYTAHRR